MDKFSPLGNSEIEAVEHLYSLYLKDPGLVDPSWQKFFEGFEFARAQFPSGVAVQENLDKEFRVIRLIEGYRKRGHLFTETNPVRARRKYSPTLDLENYDLSTADLDTVFQAGSQVGIGPSTLRNMVALLKQTYCRSIGVEYMYIRQPEVIEWLQARMESARNSPAFTAVEKKHIYDHLKQAVGFENFIHRKFVGQKRFSLEGGESLIPGLDTVIEHGADQGIEEFVIGMAHRGRLNTLANIIKKPYEDIFREFTGKSYDKTISLGDVKYHLGYCNEIVTDKGKTIRLNLAPNPSHLEAVSPVVEGISRARINLKYQGDTGRLCPILIHGDAAIAAQGVVYEVAQMSQLEGYRTGGTIHLVINNQVGFTTNYIDARSSTYCTDIGKVIKAPIFHVNGDDVEALIFTIRLAMEYRQTFHTDVFIDILGYRKHGHNEGDEPRFTQPLLYKAIENHPNPRDIYSAELVKEGIMTSNEVAKEEKEYEHYLEGKLIKSKADSTVHIQQFLFDEWKGFDHPGPVDLKDNPPTGIKKQILIELAKKIHHLPDDRKFFKKLYKIIEDRHKMVENGTIDWALAELLAYASLVTEGIPVRLSGQDSIRGTFAHRHAAFYIEDSTEVYYPLQHISKNQASFDIYNSPLSEYGVMGFEYGYALATPRSLTIWEAQFGDFYNVAQVIIDQFISSAGEKWGVMNGLVLYLPHGYEGQGPEHSSGRIERFLTMTANNNIQVVTCTTPANFFHVLRRQVSRPFRIPLVIFTPKSLLRHPSCISSIDELAKGSFHEVIDDEDVDAAKVTRVVFCSGKVYYDLVERKKQLNARDVALVRIEQLFPFPADAVNHIMQRYKKAVLQLWVQEEPENMGAWRYIQDTCRTIDFVPVARRASGSPATGLSGLHAIGQEEIVSRVFRKCTCELKNNYCALQCVEGKSRKEILDVHQYFQKDARFTI
jgi:2-oxoglutarate dehydrogenase E1 component